MPSSEAPRANVDAKVYLANERTFLTWMRQAVLLGGIGSALSGLAAYQGVHSELKPGPHGSLAAVAQLKAAGGVLLLTAAALAAAAGRNFYRRGQMIRAGEPSDSRGWYTVWLPRLLTGALSAAMASVWAAAVLRLLPERGGAEDAGGGGG